MAMGVRSVKICGSWYNLEYPAVGSEAAVEQVNEVYAKDWTVDDVEETSDEEQENI